MYAYDKVIMLAGGVGYAAAKDAIKGVPEAGESVVVMGGDNYRIGMGGGAVSSVETGQYASGIELNAVQRANPEMQKRVSNVIRALAENDNNPIVSIHDHGAGGHLNALSELVEETGGKIDIDALPIGDHTLSSKEIIGNESQERMGMVLKKEDIDYVRTIADRERAPMYVVGETTGDHRFVFEQKDGVKPIDLAMTDMFGSSPKTTLTDTTVETKYTDADYNEDDIERYTASVLSLEAVACKDWLTNKVDRSVTGKIARQQCQGEIQLPLSDCGVVALDYSGTKGIATSIGHAPQVALIDSAKGSVVAVAEALTNIVATPLSDGIKGLSLSANWMWPCKNPGEDAALSTVLSRHVPISPANSELEPPHRPGPAFNDTEIWRRQGICSRHRHNLRSRRGQRRPQDPQSRARQEGLYTLLYRLLSPIRSNSAVRLSHRLRANSVRRLPLSPTQEKFVNTFETVQTLVKRGKLLAAHDVSAGGLVTTLLEMTFANTDGGIEIDTTGFEAIGETNLVKILFAENPALVAQVEASKIASVDEILTKAGVRFCHIGAPTAERTLIVNHKGTHDCSASTISATYGSTPAISWMPSRAARNVPAAVLKTIRNSLSATVSRLNSTANSARAA